jgi:hypothetical protein
MSDLPTRCDAQNSTRVVTDGPVPVVRTAGGTRRHMHLIFRSGAWSGALMEIRPDSRPGLFLVRTADRPAPYLVAMDPEMGRRILRAWLLADPGRAYAASLARSMQRQQEVARHRLENRD